MSARKTPITALPERAEAELAGKVHFTAPEPCFRGHAPLRYTKTSVCVACLSERHKGFPRRLSTEDKRVEAAEQKGMVIYQSTVRCHSCNSTPHRIVATRHCMTCNMDEVNAPARAVARRWSGRAP